MSVVLRLKKPRRAVCGTRGSLRTRHGGGSAPSCCAFTHILECEVKWALESTTTNKASGGDGIPVELFQILKDAAVKVLHSVCQHIWKTQQWPQEWKWSVFIPIPKKGNAKECSNYRTIVFGPAVTRAQPPHFHCNSRGRLGFPGPTQGEG